jgi:hypothetical protein
VSNHRNVIGTVHLLATAVPRRMRWAIILAVNSLRKSINLQLTICVRQLFVPRVAISALYELTAHVDHTLLLPPFEFIMPFTVPHCAILSPLQYYDITLHTVSVL